MLHFLKSAIIDFSIFQITTPPYTIPETTVKDPHIKNIFSQILLLVFCWPINEIKNVIINFIFIFQCGYL